ncbi:hypothetical protein ACFO5O_07870 [Geojedonia litorea]|uniref:Uncharacterized protein n=1 Tax=Geojedonia litorea TaxID=1268269 RepID=A0ABV9N430_9FLAO
MMRFLAKVFLDSFNYLTAIALALSCDELDIFWVDTYSFWIHDTLSMLYIGSIYT